MKTIFINNIGELNEKGEGKIATIKDLNERLCMGYEPYLGVLQTSSGVVTFYSNLESDEEIQEVGEICEYIKISDIILDEPECIETREIRMLTKKNSIVDKIKEVVSKSPLVAIFLVEMVVVQCYIFFSKISIHG